MMKVNTFSICLILASTLSLSVAGTQATERAKALAPVCGSGFPPSIPNGISPSLWRRHIPSNNLLTAAKVELGRRLFFDKRLSADRTISCATCHDPATAFADRNSFAVGIQDSPGQRNAPSVLNAMFNRFLFWDGRVSTLEEQAKQPLVNSREMGMQTYDQVEARVKTLPEYTSLFHQAFGTEAISIDRIARAIACFERTLLSANSPFDRFISGEQSAISETQKQGWLLFRGKAGCTACHEFQLSSPFFTDFKFHNTGIAMGAGNLERLVADAKALMAQNSEKPTNPKNANHSSPKTDRFGELGRFVESGQQSDIGSFKTPSLRDVELTAPYMHDGSVRTLLDVVRFYNLGGKPNPYLDKEIRPLNLSDQEMNALVEFLRSLTSDDVLRMVQSSQPQNRAPASLQLDRSR